MKRLLLLGAGHAHLQVLQAIAEAPLPGVAVLLVSPSAEVVYSGMLPGVVAGHYAIDDARIAIAPLAAAARAERIEAAATGIDTARRCVRTGDREHGYDMLSIDTGGEPDRASIPGAAEHAIFVRPVGTFAAEWPRVAERVAAGASAIVVVGGGAAGVEIALAVRHRLGARSSVHLVTGGDALLLAGHAPRAQRLARAALRRASVSVFDDRCAAIAAGRVQLGGGTTLACDAAIVATGAVAPGWLAGSGLALDAHGFVAIGATLQSTSHREVYAVGDAASRVDAEVPKNGVHAVRAAPVLALNLRRALAGGTLESHVAPRRALSLISLGAQRAIASWGAFAGEGAWAWRWKDRIDREWIARFAAASGATRAAGSR